MKISKELTEKQRRILEEKETEPAFTGKLLHNEKKGTYSCVNCGNVLFDSETKFDSKCGWPSFYDALSGAVKFKEDNSLNMRRIEVVCGKCGGHLGHVFEDGPKDKTGKRYCINSEILDFEEKEK